MIVWFGEKLSAIFNASNYIYRKKNYKKSKYLALCLQQPDVKLLLFGTFHVLEKGRRIEAGEKHMVPALTVSGRALSDITKA